MPYDKNKYTIVVCNITNCTRRMIAVEKGTYSCGFGLYHLSSNADAQEKMYAETRVLLPDKGAAVTEKVLERAAYTKAVVKETFRMNPISVGIGRVLPEECVFSGYRVPAGVSMLAKRDLCA